MTPLCPQCYASLVESAAINQLHCPSCDYTWSRLSIDFSPDEDGALAGDAEEVDYLR